MAPDVRRCSAVAWWSSQKVRSSSRQCVRCTLSSARLECVNDESRSPGMVKVRLHGSNGEIETPWAERVDANLFRLDNLPWFAYGVSDDDVVEGAVTDADGVFEFMRVVIPSGNRLIRVILEDPADPVAYFRTSSRPVVTTKASTAASLRSAFRRLLTWAR